MEEIKRQTLAILVDNEAGVLSQVSRLFSRKGYNIESIVSGDTDKPGVTRITIAIMADSTAVATPLVTFIAQLGLAPSQIIPVRLAIIFFTADTTCG